MGRPQRVYDLIEPAGAELIAPRFQGPGWTVNAHGTAFDFSPYASLGKLAGLLRDDFAEWAPVQTRKTAMDRYRRLRMFLDYALTGSLGTPPELSRMIMALYAAHLAKRAVGTQTVLYADYQALAHHVRRLQGDGKLQGFRIPRKFTRAWAEAAPVATLSESIASKSELDGSSKALLGTLLAFAWAEIRDSLGRIEEANRASERCVGGLVPRELGSLVAYVDDRFGGVPTAYASEEARAQPDQHRYRYALERHGGLRRVAAHLGPTVRMLVPFSVVFAAANINPQSILKLRVDDLRETNRAGWKKLDWEKARAGGEVDGLEFPLGGPGAPTVPRAFEALLKLTKRFRRSATERDADAAFLAWMPNQGRGTASGVIRVPSHAMLLHAFKDFRADFYAAHPEMAGSGDVAPAFALENVRATAINVLHADLGRDTEGTRVGARHRHRTMTARYLRHPEHAAAREDSIRGSQRGMLAWVRDHAVSVVPAIPEAVAEALNIGDGEADAWIAGARNAVGHGFQCRNPLTSPMPGQAAGRLCTFFIGCFSCPNSLVIATPLTAARLVLWQRHLEASRARLAADNADRWNLIYEPQVLAIAAALEDFPPDTLVAGRDLAQRLRVPLPTVE